MEVGTSGRARVSMFYAVGENIGKTTALVNTALLLADRGLRVAIVDARQGEARVARYLEHGLADRVTTDPGEPFQQGVIRVVELSRRQLFGLAEEGRSAVRLELYDHVLIDAPVLDPEDDLAGLAALADVLVPAFSLNSWSIEATVAVTRALLAEPHPEPVAVVPVGLRADARKRDRLRTARGLVHRTFRPLAGGPVRYQEIPYDPGYEQSLTLAYQAESETQIDGLRPFYRRLTDEIAEVRRPVAEARVVFAPPHQAWAEWLAGYLSQLGLVTRTIPTAAYGNSGPDADHLLFVIVPPRSLGAYPTPVVPSEAKATVVLVDDIVLPPELEHHDQLDLRHLGVAEALESVRRVVETRTRVSSDAPPPASPFPVLPAGTVIAPRDNAFVGRDEWLVQMREQLMSEPGRRLLLLGEPGVGKSKAALEYCYRHAGDYRLILWARSGDPQAVTGLANVLGLSTGDDPDRVRDRLESELGPWLLVLDDLEPGSALSKIIPSLAGQGHLLITARSRQAAPETRSLELPPFTAVEARRMLRRELPDISFTHAEQVGGLVGYVPILVGLAARWLAMALERLRGDTNQDIGTALDGAVAEFAARFQGIRAQLQEQSPVVPPARVMLELVLAALNTDRAAEAWCHDHPEDGPLPWLAETCAVLAADLLDQDVLLLPAMQTKLARLGDADSKELLSDGLLVDVSIWALARHGLLTLDEGRTKPVHQHRMLRELLLDRMGSEKHRERLGELRHVLSRAGKGAGASGGAVGALTDAVRAWEDDTPLVRRWFLGHLETQVQQGGEFGLHRVMELGVLAKEDWAEYPDSVEYLRLLGVLSQASGALGDNKACETYAREALYGRQRVLGVRHPSTVRSLDAYGRAMRGRGRFTEALARARAVRDLTELMFGPGHRFTLQTEHNYALSELFVGRAETALELLQQQYNKRRAMSSRLDADSWHVLVSLAFCQRALGQNRESHDLLKGMLARQSLVTTDGIRPSALVGVELGLAVAERRLGRLDEALERDERLVAGAREGFGPRSINVPRALTSLAADRHRLGKHVEALEAAGEARDILETTLGRAHPYALVACGLTTVYRRALGHAADAVEDAERAVEGLTDTLGGEHPWTLAAMVSLANIEVALGRFDRAEPLELAALNAYRALPYDHPDAALVADNLADSQWRRNSGTPDQRLNRDIDVELAGL